MMAAFDERRSADRPTSALGALGRQAKSVHSILILFGFVAGALMFAANDHTLAQNAVQHEEFRDTTKAVRAHIDSVAGILSVLSSETMENRASIDTALAQIKAMLEANQRSQLRSLCAAVKSDADICHGGTR